MKLYKVLAENGRPYHGGKGTWSLPNDQPGEWESVTGELIPCVNGLHLCRTKDLLRWLGPVIYLAEHDGELIDHTDKVVVRKARLVSRLDTWNERAARKFACDCAERALKRERKAGREPDERAWQAVAVARAFAESKASDDDLAAARDAARAAARDAARAAARDAARAAARAAARDAARAAARAAARDAARDAEREWQTRRLFEYLNGKRT